MLRPSGSRLLLTSLAVLLLAPAHLRAQPADRQLLNERRAALAVATTPTARTRALMDLSWKLLDLGLAPDSSLYYARQSYQQAQQAGNRKLLAEATYLTSEYYVAAQRYPLAEQWLRQAESYFPDLSQGARARVLGNLGSVYRERGQFDLATRYQRRAFRQASQTPASERDYLHGRFAMELSKTFYSQQQLDSTAHWARLAYRYYQQAGDTVTAAHALTQEAVVLLAQKQWALAAQALRRVLAVQQAQQDDRGLPLTFISLGHAVAKQDSGALALRYLRTAMRYARKIGQVGALPAIYNNCGLAYRALHRPDSAEYWYLRAIAEQRRQGGEASALKFRLGAGLFYRDVNNLAAAAQQARAVLSRASAATSDQLASAYELLRADAVYRADYPAAYQLLQRENALRDSLRRRDSRRLTAELRVRYETARAEQQVLTLTQRGRLQVQQQELVRLRSQRELAGLGAGASLIIGLLGGVLALLRRRQRRREATLRTKLAADLHDDVGALLTQLSFDTAVLQSQPATSADQHTRLARMATASQQAVRQLREVVWSVDSRHDSFAGLLDRLRDYAHDVLPAAGIEIDFRVEPVLYTRQLAPAARQALYLIYKEALHNLVKHAHASEATVRLAVLGHALEMTLDDDGPTTPGQVQAQHHGLDNMRRRAQELGGQVAYEPNPTGPGWRVRLTLPLR